MAWLGTWAKRISLTIDKDLIDTAAQTDFPVMVYLSAASGIGDVDTSPVFDELTSDANRKKIAVTSSDGTTQLYVEIEKWEDENEVAWLHVKVPTVAYDADTILYLYYDSAQADNTTYIGDTTDAVTHNVWNSDFTAVWHMAQDPDSDVADAIKDSTSAAIELTPNGSMVTADLISAKVGDGIAFDGTGDCLETNGNESSLNIGASEEFFVDFAIYFDAFPANGGESDHIFSLANPTDDRRSYICDIIQSGAKFYLRFHPYNGTAATTAFAQIELEAAELVVSTWYHIAVQRSGNLVYFYINGALHDSGVAFNPASIYNNTDDPFYINSFHGTWSLGEFTIDEFRMSIGEPRSAAWAKATYNSLWDSLITFGTEVGITVEVSATSVSLTVTPNTATIIGSTSVSAESVSLTITSYAAIVAVFDVDVAATLGTLTITPNSAIVGLDVSVSATSASLSITTYNVHIPYPENITETTMLYETLSIEWPKSIESTAEITDAVTADIGTVLYDWLGTEETLTNNWTGTETIEETVHPIEKLIFGWLETLTSTANAADAPTIETLWQIIEYLNAQDTVTNNWTGTENITSTLSMFGQAMVAQLFNESVTSTAAAVEVITYLHRMVSVANSTFAATETSSVDVTFNPSVSESIAITGLLSVFKTINESISDSPTISDAITITWPKSISETLTAADVTTLQWMAIHILTESLVATETAIGLFNFSDTISETLEATAVLTLQQILQANVEEILNFGVTIRLDDEVWECWVMNGSAFNMSVYSNFDFNSYAVYNDQAFGCREDGIYRLDGDDDNGTTINAGIILPETDFGTLRDKRFRKAYFGISGTSPAIRMETDTANVTYTISSSKANIQRNQKGKEWTLKVSGYDDMDFIELVPVILTR